MGKRAERLRSAIGQSTDKTDETPTGGRVSSVLSVTEQGGEADSGGFVGFVGDSVPGDREAMLAADPFRAWYHRNAELLTDTDRRLGHDAGGFCAAHNRWLSYPEQRRGACSWCVPVDPDREPEYWASHGRTFTERRN